MENDKLHLHPKPEREIILGEEGGLMEGPIHIRVDKWGEIHVYVPVMTAAGATDEYMRKRLGMGAMTLMN